MCLIGAAGCDEPKSGSADDEKPAAESSESSAKQADASGTTPEEHEQASTDESSEDDPPGPPILKGEVRPGKVTESSDLWRKRLESVEIDEDVAAKLGDVDPGATVQVYFGTWCGDSHREVPRLWKSLETLEGDVPFDVEYVALDHNFDAGEVSIEGKDIQYVPTFVVRRDGKEVGRIVESAPQTLEEDLLALLSGEKEGVVSGREDM